ncbi:MAG: hypothetical protein Q9169_005859 [Polycauliona sp. 2 TL-2023]
MPFRMSSILTLFAILTIPLVAVIAGYSLVLFTQADSGTTLPIRSVFAAVANHATTFCFIVQPKLTPIFEFLLNVVDLHDLGFFFGWMVCAWLTMKRVFALEKQILDLQTKNDLLAKNQAYALEKKALDLQTEIQAEKAAMKTHLDEVRSSMGQFNHRLASIESPLASDETEDFEGFEDDQYPDFME